MGLQSLKLGPTKLSLHQARILIEKFTTRWQVSTQQDSLNTCFKIEMAALKFDRIQNPRYYLWHGKTIPSAQDLILSTLSTC